MAGVTIRSIFNVQIVMLLFPFRKELSIFPALCAALYPFLIACEQRYSVWPLPGITIAVRGVRLRMNTDAVCD